MAIQISKTRVLKIIGIPIGIAMVLWAILQFQANKYVTAYINEEIPKDINLTYDQLQLNILKGSIVLNGVSMYYIKADTTSRILDVQIDVLSMDGFGYFNYFFHNRIGAQKISLLKPIVRYRLGHDFKKSKRRGEIAAKIKSKISLDRFEVIDGELIGMAQAGDSVKLKVEQWNMEVAELKTDGNIVQNAIPLHYEGYSLKTGRVFLDLGPFETLSIKACTVAGEELSLKQLLLKSKYTRQELSKRLNKEHDHIQLSIAEVASSKIDFGFNVERFFLRAQALDIHDPNLVVYRDKLVKDDWEKKRLYSKMIRELPVDLDISQTRITNGEIAYSELVQEGGKPGQLTFTHLDATLNNISNTYEPGNKTKIEISSKLMGHAPIYLYWDFDYNDNSDAFFLRGVVRDFKSRSINEFLIPNLRSKAEGDIKELYFTISGDAISAGGDMKMKYEDFRFEVLKKDRLGVNKLLTFIGNIFTNDGSNTDKEGYRYGSVYAERDVTKSFFNYLWLNVKDGIVDTLTGDGEKD